MILSALAEIIDYSTFPARCSARCLPDCLPGVSASHQSHTPRSKSPGGGLCEAVPAPNALMATHLANGSNNFVIPFWSDASELEADITSDGSTKMFPARAALGELVPGVLAIGGVADKDGDYSFGH